MVNIEIKNMDGLEYLETIKDKTVDLFLLDLPYGQTDNKWDIKLNINKIWKLIRKKIKTNGQILFFCTTRFGYELINSNPNWFCQDFVWEKSNSVGFLLANKAVLRKHEMIYLFKPWRDADYFENSTSPKYNKKNREYAEKYYNYLKNKGVKSKEIFKISGSSGFGHFLGYHSKQFRIPPKEQYKKVSKYYKVDEQPFFLTYEKLIEKVEKKPKPPKHTYNPQKIKGKFVKGNLKGYTDSNYGIKNKITYDSEFRYPHSILKFGYDKEKLHSTQKPVGLLEWLIKTYSNKNDLVVDFCLGSGSTAVACCNTERNFKGSEIDENFYKISIKRILEHTKNNKNISFTYDKK